MAMSFFGKLKSLQSGPPAPPRRTENAGGPQNVVAEKECDTYEVPPCERVAATVSQRQVEENVYLERSPNPAIAQRQAAPPPPLSRSVKPQQHAEDPINDPHVKKPPEINRNEKPGKKKLLFSPPPPPDEDVYLDPNEEQDEGDDVYLEPTDARRPARHGPMPMPPSPQTQFRAPPVPTVKLTIPRAKSSSILPSLTEVKTGAGEPTVRMRRDTFPSILPPLPAPSVRPPLPTNMTEAKVREDRLESSSGPVRTDMQPGGLSSSVRTTKVPGMEDKEWFAGDCNRKTAEALLLRVNKDGAFLIRHSSAQSSRQPYTLAVFCKDKVYNIPIRFLEELQGFALGLEGKINEEAFCTLDEMISHHQHNQLLLINSKSQAKHSTYLTHPARP